MGLIKCEIREDLTIWEFTGDAMGITNLEFWSKLKVRQGKYKGHKTFHIETKQEPTPEAKAQGWSGWTCSQKIEIGDVLVVGEDYFQILKPTFFHKIFKQK